VYRWVGEKYVCVDLTKVSSLMGLTNEDFTVGQVTLKAASSKVVKYERVYSNNQHVFILFAFDTFSFLAPEAVNILKRIQRSVHSNVVFLMSQNIVFKMIGFTIKKNSGTTFYLFTFH
jgi:hypothetical protein